MKRRRPTLLRLGLEVVALVVIHAILLQGLARLNLLEHLLAPGAGSRAALAATAIFLLLRIFLFVVAPGWIAVRLWLWATRSRSEWAIATLAAVTSYDSSSDTGNTP